MTASRPRPGARRGGSDRPVMLAETLDLIAAAPLRQQLLARRGQPCTLDGSAVRVIGGLCLQVLLAAQTSWARDKLPFKLAHPSPELVAQLAVFGAVSLSP